VLCLGVGSDGLGALLFEGARSPTIGRLDPRLLETCLLDAALLDAALLDARGLEQGMDDAVLAKAERRRGRGLAELLRTPGMGEVADALGGAWASAAAVGGRVDLLVDARTDALRGLPWELLEGAPADAGPAAGLRVTRLAPGSPFRDAGAADRIEVVLWVPQPDDPVCARVAGALRERLRAFIRVTTIESSPPPLARGVLRVVHVVCRGEPGADQRAGELRLVLGGGRLLDSVGAADVLRPALRGASLAVLDVCGGVHANPGPTASDPAAVHAVKLVGCGVPAVLAPRFVLDSEGAGAVSAALYRALDAGLRLSEAVDDARRALAALGIAQPAFRSWNPTFVVSDGRALDLGIDFGVHEPHPAWRRAAPDVAPILGEALRLGSVQGFIGLEHLALALARAPAPGPVLALVQAQLAQLAEGVAAWAPSSGRVTVTPRLARALAALPDPFDADALLRALASMDPVRRALPGLARLVARPPAGPGTRLASDPTVGPVTRPLAVTATYPPHESGDGMLLEVVGGPEDGRALRLVPGRALLGRQDPDRREPAEELFLGGPSDPAVSRRHLSWSGGGRMRALAHVVRLRDGAEEGFDAAFDVRPGDVLQLGLGTRLEVVRLPGAA
jgi:hypothetical protein